MQLIATYYNIVITILIKEGITMQSQTHYKHGPLYRHYYSYNRAQLSRVHITNHVIVNVRHINFDVYNLTLEQLIDKLSIDPNLGPAFSSWHNHYPAGDKISQDFVNFYLKNNRIQIDKPLHQL